MLKMLLFGKKINLVEICKKGNYILTGKHKLHGYRVEVSVLPNALAMMERRNYTGSVNDLVRIQYMKEHYIRETTKKPDKNNVSDDGVVHSESTRIIEVSC